MNENKLKEVFTPVLAWLDAGAPHSAGRGFNMNFFLNLDAEDYAGFTCDTVCCIAGALMEFNPKTFTLRIEALSGYRACNVIGYKLGMTKEAAEALFLPSDRDLSTITPAEAARAIRHYLKTGEVRWS